MPSVKVNGVRMNYIQLECEYGNKCEDLVMVHGLATNLAFWYFRHAPAFSKRYRITLYDLRGHGRSGITNSGYTAKNMAVDLERLLDHLGIERAHFIGHSFGGVVSLSLACRDSARFLSLMMVDSHISAVRRLKNTRKWVFGEKIQQILDKNSLDIDVREPYFGYKLLHVVARLKIQNVDVSEELKDLVSPLMGDKSNRTANKWLKLMDTTKAEKELMNDDGLTLESLRKLRFPIHAMYGEHSPSVPTGEQLLRVWKHAEFLRIRDAGHFFPLTRPSEFVKNCQRFWANVSYEIPKRNGDSNKRYFRSDRFYNRDGKWFLDIRKSKNVGPFADLNAAKGYLMTLLDIERDIGKVELLCQD